MPLQETQLTSAWLMTRWVAAWNTEHITDEACTSLVTPQQ